jgi:hypothetical protein
MYKPDFVDGIPYYSSYRDGLTHYPSPLLVLVVSKRPTRKTGASVRIRETYELHILRITNSRGRATVRILWRVAESGE